MDPIVTAHLLDINREFYQSFGPAFAATRRRIQPGVRRVLNSLPPGGDWLDLGCGSGALACEWALTGRTGSYTGLDFSAALLDEARLAATGLDPDGLRVEFIPVDLSAPDWAGGLPDSAAYTGVLAFAVLHHLPGAGLRHRLLSGVHRLLRPGGVFIHSEWQFQHSPKLLTRRQPWETVGLGTDEVEPGDTLLDWRYTLPGQAGQVGLRYVHLFSRAELSSLADETGFVIHDEFESDGEGGRLGLYQVWRAV